jgi:hypothetical protein
MRSGGWEGRGKGGWKGHEESNLDPPSGDGGAPAPRSGRQPIYSRTSSEAIQTVPHHVENWDTIKQNWCEESLISRRHTPASHYTSMTIVNSWPSYRHRSQAPQSVLGCACPSRVRRNSSSSLPPCGPGKPCLRRCPSQVRIEQCCRLLVFFLKCFNSCNEWYSMGNRRRWTCVVSRCVMCAHLLALQPVVAFAYVST